MLWWQMKSGDSRVTWDIFEVDCSWIHGEGWGVFVLEIVGDSLEFLFC